MPKQELSEWCWAATTAAIQAFYRERFAKSQCEIATEWLGMQCCPPGDDERSNPRNRPYNLEMVLGGNRNGPARHEALEFDGIVREINAGNPICCAIRWRNGTMHFNIVVGYLPGQVIVRDPKYPGDHKLQRDEFAKRYRGEGEWVATLLTRKA